MQALVKFHQALAAADPTPEHLRLYAAAPKIHGFSNDQKDSSLFLATFILGLYQTMDPETKTFRTVPFAVSRSLDSWAVATINGILGKIQKVRSKIANKDERANGNKMIVQAVTNLELGTRVFSVAEEPLRWIAFGFTHESSAPDWLKKGLLR